MVNEHPPRLETETTCLSPPFLPIVVGSDVVSLMSKKRSMGKVDTSLPIRTLAHEGTVVMMNHQQAPNIVPDGACGSSSTVPSLVRPSEGQALETQACDRWKHRKKNRFHH